jgi:hypothetical protein
MTGGRPQDGGVIVEADAPGGSKAERQGTSDAIYQCVFARMLCGYALWPGG